MSKCFDKIYVNKLKSEMSMFQTYARNHVKQTPQTGNTDKQGQVEGKVLL